jgi:metallo-beta-lactamase family protein
VATAAAVAVPDRRRFPPLYGPLEANAAIERLVPTPFEQETELAPGVSLRFVANAHILGSACALITAREHGVERRVLFSGDVGHPGVRIAKAPDPPPPCDALVLESTYGDRDHRSPEATFDEFAALLEQAVQRRGVVLVPAFAIGRAQTLLWMISEVVRTRRLPRFPVYLDSPMAVDVTRIHQRWREELLNEEGRRRLAADGRLLLLDDFHQVREADASRRLNDLEGPAVIVAPSGMCTGGRILHHLRHHIGSPSTTVLIVGFQGAGTIGRELVEGARTIEIFGESLPVRAQVRTLNGLSAHAGRSELLAWVEPLVSKPPMLFLNHGEDRPRASLAAAMKERFGHAPFLPQHGQEFVV